MAEAGDVVKRLRERDRQARFHNSGVYDRGGTPEPTIFGEAADTIERLQSELEGRGECICPNCGIRHGISNTDGGF